MRPTGKCIYWEKKALTSIFASSCLIFPYYLGLGMLEKLSTTFRQSSLVNAVVYALTAFQSNLVDPWGHQLSCTGRAL